MEEHRQVSRRNGENLADFVGAGFVEDAEGEGVGQARGESVEALGEGGVKFLTFEEFVGRESPAGGPLLPAAQAGKLGIDGGVGGFGERLRTCRGAETVGKFAAQAGDQRGACGGAALEGAAGGERGEKGFLDEFFGGGAVADADEGVAEEDVGVLVHPGLGRGRRRGDGGNGGGRVGIVIGVAEHEETPGCE